MAISVALVLLSALSHSGGEILEHRDRRLPVDTRISDADAPFQAGGALWWYFLVALVDIRLDHDASDGHLALAQLVANHLGDLGLIAVVLAGVAYVIVSGPSLATFQYRPEFIPWEQSTIMAIF